jgi:hypothetical protein
MNWQNIRRRLRPDYLILPLIMVLGFYMAFIPHLSYPYPVHLDEWIHLACSNQVINQGTAVGLTDPFSGGEPNANQVFEVGFHVFWAVFHQISGLPWLDIYKYCPSIIFLMTVLSVYVLAQREGFGWEAALFTCLITTTVGILGPGFLVPVAMGLLFIPLFFFIAFNFRNWWSYVVLLIFMSFLVSLHPGTAVNLAIVFAPFILLNLKSDFRHSLMIALAVAIPFFAPFPWIFRLLLPTAKSLLIPYTGPAFGGVVDIPRIMTTYGELPIVLCLLGVFLLAIRGGKKGYGLILGLLALLLMLVTFFGLHYGVGILYARGLVLAMLMISIVAGAGLMGVKNLRLPARLTAWLKTPLITKNVGNILCLVVIGLTLALAIPSRQHIPYYYMIDSEDYQAFVWIKENTDSSYDKAILDPWKGTAFTAVTGKKVYTRIGEAPKSSDLEAYDFLRGGSRDTDFLRENGISIVYTPWGSQNPDLVEVRNNVYLLKEVEEPKQK